jgi:hypothetical protein
LINAGIVGGWCWDKAGSTSSPIGEHPLVAAARAVGEVLDQTAGLDPIYLTPQDKSQVLVELTRSLARVGACVRRCWRLPTTSRPRPPTDRGTWLAVETRTSRREAVHVERLGVALRERWSGVGEAVAAGRVTWEQAAVLAQALDQLPCGLGSELRAKAEAHLVAEAGHFGPVQLRRLGRHVLEVVAPDIADEEEERGLCAEERRAGRRPDCGSVREATARPTCTPGCPTRSPLGCGPTSTPTPHPAVPRPWRRPRATSTGCRRPANAERPSAPCWSTFPARDCPDTVARPRR